MQYQGMFHVETTSQVLGSSPYSSGNTWMDYGGMQDVVGISQLFGAPLPSQPTQYNTVEPYGTELPRQERHVSY
uniref:Uncharacterized protein n=1 Tax=Arundo donax TaxID=35708 RepID=A0A0A8ZPP2_ARUDO